jgi:hypothetical protein
MRVRDHLPFLCLSHFLVVIKHRLGRTRDQRVVISLAGGWVGRLHRGETVPMHRPDTERIRDLFSRQRRGERSNSRKTCSVEQLEEALLWHVVARHARLGHFVLQIAPGEVRQEPGSPVSTSSSYRAPKAMFQPPHLLSIEVRSEARASFAPGRPRPTHPNPLTGR